MKSFTIFSLIFCYVQLSKHEDPAPASKSTQITVDTDFGDICPQLERSAFNFETLGSAQICLRKLMQYDISLAPYEKGKYNERSKLTGGVEAIADAISRIPAFPSLTKGDITDTNINDRVGTAQQEVDDLEMEMIKKQKDLKEAQDNLARLANEYTEFEAFGLLSISKTLFTSFGFDIFWFIYNDDTICFRRRYISLPDARRLNSNIDHKIPADIIHFLYPFDFSTQKIVQLTTPYLHSLALSILDEDTCKASAPNKLDRKRLHKLYDRLYTLVPEYLGHYLLSTSCYVKSSEKFEAKRIIATLNSSQSFSDTIDSSISTLISGKTFIFQYDSFEDIVKEAVSSVCESRGVKTFLNDQAWGKVLVECKVRKSVKVWIEKSLEKREYSIAAISCIGTEIGVIVLLILYLLIRPF